MTGGGRGLVATSASAGSFTLNPFFREQIHIRASAAGDLFGLWHTSGSPSGFQTLSVRGKDLKAVYNHESSGHLAPGPDGRTLFTGRSGRRDAEGKPVGRPGGAPENRPGMTIPSQDLSFYLAVEETPDPENPVKVSVHVAADDARLVSVHGLGEMRGAVKDESGARDDFTIDKRFHFLPDAHLLVTIPASNDRLVLRRLDLDAALHQRGDKSLLVTSPASLIAKAGSPFRHKIVVKPDRPGVTFTLSTGPDGLLVAPDGTVTWTPPNSAAGEESKAIVTVADSSGDERFHTLIIRVK